MTPSPGLHLPASRRARIAAFAGAVVVLLSTGVTLAGPGDELSACRSTKDGHSQVSVRADRWVRIGAPKFDSDEGPSTLTAFAALPYRANGLFVTNGQVIKLSADAGCTWETVFRGDSVRSSAPGYSADVFTQLVAPTDTTLWASSYDDIDGVPHPHVYAGGQLDVDGKTPTFTQVDTGLPAYGRPVTLSAAPVSTGEAYVLLDELPDPRTGAPTVASRHLYTTYVPSTPPQAGALGLAWEEIAPPAGFGRIDGVVRQDSRTIWIWSGDSYAWASHVDASPVSWHVGHAFGRIATIDVDAGGRVAIVAAGGQGASLSWPDGHGGVVPVGSVPVLPGGFAHGTEPDVYVASGRGGTWGYDHRLGRWIDITPRGGPSFGSLAMGQATSARVVLGLTSTALWRWDTYAGETFVEPPRPLQGHGGYPRLPTSSLHAPVLTPTRQVVTVTPGALRDVPVTLRVPPAPTPLDVYFLVDTTGSMSPAIAGLQKSITSLAHDLRSRLGIAACFGIGAFNDVGAVYSDPHTTPYIFRTLLPVSPCDRAPGLPKVHAAANQLKESLLGDEPEAQTLALTQAVTGSGNPAPPVSPGQQAGFRHGAFKVIVLISDSDSHEGNGYPTVEQTVRTLSSADIKVVSIAVDDGAANLGAAKAMMTRIAEGTGSLAPSTGVDCNGDGGGGYGDLDPGAPLVCVLPVASTGEGSGKVVHVGPAILGLLLAVKDPGSVAVQVADPDGAVHGQIRGSTSEIFDLKYETGLHFTLPLGCSGAQVGHDLPVDLTPVVRSRPLALRGQVVVQCRKPPLLPALPPIAAAPALVYAVPGARPPVAAAVPPPNAPAQPPTNVNPNTGAARQEDQQPQLATAAQDNAAAPEDTEVVQMSALGDRRWRSDAVFVLGAAAVLTAAAGCQLQLRRRTAPAGSRR